MTYQQFVNRISNQLNTFLEDGTISEVHTSLKNNGITRLGVTISNPEINISPTIYLEEFYKQYQNGVHLLDIIRRILDIYDEVRFEHSWEVGELHKFDTIRHKVAYKLIHQKENAMLLQEVPYVPFHDLAVVFFLLMDIAPSGSATILVTNDMQRAWDVSLEELFKTASLNAPRLLPADFRPMRAVVCEMLGTNCTSEDLAENHMYILTNSIKQFGAASILYKNVLEEIASELRDDFYILPSSIHEVIILPKRYSPSSEELDQMIIEINKTQISPDEILSDHAYYYSRLHKSLFLRN